MHYRTLVHQLARHHRISQKTARRFADNVFRIIVLATADGHRIRVPHFGTFMRRTVRSRAIKLPTGQTALVPEQRALSFRRARTVDLTK